MLLVQELRTEDDQLEAHLRMQRDGSRCASNARSDVEHFRRLDVCEEEGGHDKRYDEWKGALSTFRILLEDDARIAFRANRDRAAVSDVDRTEGVLRPHASNVAMEDRSANT